MSAAGRTAEHSWAVAQFAGDVFLEECTSYLAPTLTAPFVHVACFVRTHRLSNTDDTSSTERFTSNVEETRASCVTVGFLICRCFFGGHEPLQPDLDYTFRRRPPCCKSTSIPGRGGCNHRTRARFNLRWDVLTRPSRRSRDSSLTSAKYSVPSVGRFPS